MAVSEAEFKMLEEERAVALAFANRFGLDLADRERLAGQYDVELRARVEELAVEHDNARACQAFVRVLQQQRRWLAALDCLVASPPGPFAAVASTVDDRTLPEQMAASAALWVAVRDPAWQAAARAELARPGPDGFDERVGADEFGQRAAAADRERRLILRELDARAGRPK